MRVTSIHFDEDEEVASVQMIVSREEAAYITGIDVPLEFVEPLKLGMPALDVAKLYHKCGKITGISPDYDVTSEIYYKLLHIVDNLIEHNG